MNKENGLEKVTDLTLYTGTYGKDRCTCKCIGCTQGGGILKGKEKYQGTIEQIRTIIKKLPNLQNAYLLGNPDVSVDTDFCNEASKEFIKNDINVMFSTSGFKAVKTLKKLTSGLDTKYIKYISYSIDTLNTEKMRFLKGTDKLSLEEIEEAISYAIKKGIPVKIQPTLWEINQDDYAEIIDNFYEKFGIKWYTFHAGSFEALKDQSVNLNHIKPEKWRMITKDIQRIAKEKGLKISLPRIFLDREELEECQQNIHTYCANGGKGLQIWLEKDFIRCTYCPVLAEIHPEFTFSIEENTANFISKNGVCLALSSTLDKALTLNAVNGNGRIFNTDDKSLYTVCRYYKIKEQF